jgi:hypothetical protein
VGSSESQIDAGMRVDDGLHSIAIEIRGPSAGTRPASVLEGGRILGDSFFYYTGSYFVQPKQMARRADCRPAHAGTRAQSRIRGPRSDVRLHRYPFGQCGRNNGTALVGQHSTPFSACMTLKVPI